MMAIPVMQAAMIGIFLSAHVFGDFFIILLPDVLLPINYATQIRPRPSSLAR